MEWAADASVGWGTHRGERIVGLTSLAEVEIVLHGAFSFALTLVLASARAFTFALGFAAVVMLVAPVVVAAITRGFATRALEVVGVGVVVACEIGHGLGDLRGHGGVEVQLLRGRLRLRLLLFSVRVHHRRGGRSTGVGRVLRHVC